MPHKYGGSKSIKKGRQKHLHHSYIGRFQQELHKHFTPNNTEKEARVHPHQLKQMGSVCDYINDFTILILEITDMSNKYSLFYFPDNLKD